MQFLIICIGEFRKSSYYYFRRLCTVFFSYIDCTLTADTMPQYSEVHHCIFQYSEVYYGKQNTGKNHGIKVKGMNRSSGCTWRGPRLFSN